MGPYRNKAEIEMVKPVEILEEKIVRWRSKIPAPLLRLVGLITIVPVYIVSFFLALLLSVPSYIFTGRFSYLWDCRFNHGRVDDDFPILRGTNALYRANNKYEIARIREHFGLD